MKPRALSIQQKFRFEFSEIPRAQWNNGTVHSGCTDPTQASARLVIVLVSRIQKSGTGDSNFVKRKRTFRSDRPKWPDWSKRTTFKPGPEYSDRTKPKCSVLFDIPTETSGVWGWIEGLDARYRIHFKILLPSDLLEKGIFKGIQLRKIYTGHYRVCFYQSYHFTIPYTGNTKRAKLPWFYFSSIIIVSEYISLLYHKKVKLWNTIQQKDFFCLIKYLHIDFSVTDLYKSVHHFASILLRIKFSLEFQVKI